MFMLCVFLFVYVWEFDVYNWVKYVMLSVFLFVYVWGLDVCDWVGVSLFIYCASVCVYVCLCEICFHMGEFDFLDIQGAYDKSILI